MKTKQLKTSAIALLFGMLTGTILYYSVGHVVSYLLNPEDQVFNFVMLTNRAGISGGSGWAIKTPLGDVYTVTNSHVCDAIRDENNQVYGHSFIDRDISFPLDVIKVSETSDLCLVQKMPGATGFYLSPVPMSNHDQIKIIGFPALEPLQKTDGKVLAELFVHIPLGPVATAPGHCTAPKFRITELEVDMFGMRSKFQICEEALWVVLTTAPIFGGSSGSAVFNTLGQVVGVAFAAGNTNHAMVIKLEDVRDLVRGL